jgi:hypothetical protein
MRDQTIARPSASQNHGVQQLRRRLLQLIAASETERRTSHKIDAQFARLARPTP